MNKNDVVSTELNLRLVVPGGTALPVSAALRYDAADPYGGHPGPEGAPRVFLIGPNGRVAGLPRHGRIKEGTAQALAREEGPGR